MIFKCFWNGSLMLISLHCFDKTVILWNIIKIGFLFEYIIYSSDSKAEFLALLQSLVPHDPSEITLIFWFCAEEHFFLMLKAVIRLSIFLKTMLLCSKILS